jgi:hypothetical protein
MNEELFQKLIRNQCEYKKIYESQRKDKAKAFKNKEQKIMNTKINNFLYSHKAVYIFKKLACLEQPEEHVDDVV